jgi:superfamily II DNA or RNA helicase
MSDNKILTKPHQEYVVKYMSDPENRGLILYHSTGSGKTITSLKSMEQFSDPIVIIGRKSSKKAFKDDMKKLNIKFDYDKDSEIDFDDIDTEPRYTFYTYTKLKTLLKDRLDLLANKSIIVDEAHNLRNESSNNLMIVHAISLAKRVMLLTATPVINYLNDLAVLVNLAKDYQILPTDRDSFNAAYYNSRTNSIENPDTLVKKLSNCISYHDHRENSFDYPTSTVEYIEVEMIHEQLMEYKKYIKKYFYDVQLEFRGTGTGEYYVDFGDTYARKKNFFLSGTRQLSNTLNGKSSYPKIKAMHKMIVKQKEDGLTPLIVYSNYKENGIYALTKLLERSEISYKTITGNTSDDKINYVVDDYNKGKIDILLITSAGSESLDLKNTRIIHIMEPHWNESRIKQVIGRAIRYKSHFDLPKLERNVKIFRWSSVFPDTISNKSADEYLLELSRNKDEIFQVFDQIIQDASIENNDQDKYENYKNIRSQGRSVVIKRIKSKKKKKYKQKGGLINNIYQIYILNKSRYLELL